jgi:hypothetical protein
MVWSVISPVSLHTGGIILKRKAQMLAKQYKAAGGGYKN